MKSDAVGAGVGMCPKWTKKKGKQLDISWDFATENSIHAIFTLKI